MALAENPRGDPREREVLVYTPGGWDGQESLPAVLVLAAPGASQVALIKPQFEVGKGRVGKGGIVRDTAQHDEVCKRIESWLAARDGWRVLGLTASLITGADGNKEFLIAAKREGN